MEVLENSTTPTDNSSGDAKPKKRSRKKSGESWKKKRSPVLKLEEESQGNSDNARDLPESESEELNNKEDPNFSLLDDNFVTHYLLSRVLNQKKMEMLENEEVVAFLKSRANHNK